MRSVLLLLVQAGLGESAPNFKPVFITRLEQSPLSLPEECEGFRGNTILAANSEVMFWPIPAQATLAIHDHSGLVAVAVDHVGRTETNSTVGESSVLNFSTVGSGLVLSPHIFCFVGCSLLCFGKTDFNLFNDDVPKDTFSRSKTQDCCGEM